MPCIFEGCNNSGIHTLGVRLRRPGGTAIWAPDTDARVCGYHAGRGMRVTVQLESIGERVVDISVNPNSPNAVTRTMDINQTP